ncbi:unnamed protein product, partial [Discosporangium mesarthrocarpum]
MASFWKNILGKQIPETVESQSEGIDPLDASFARLEQELCESEKSCEVLRVELTAFVKASREMCIRADNVRSAVKLALGEVPAKEPVPQAGDRESTTSDAYRLVFLQGKCFAKLESKVQRQVLERLDDALADSVAVEGRAEERRHASNALAAAHAEYARAGGGTNGSGPPPKLVALGERVLRETQGFRAAHKRAVAELGGLLEKRREAVREAHLLLRGAQSTFFRRAHRCVTEGFDPVFQQTSKPSSDQNPSDFG